MLSSWLRFCRNDYLSVSVKLSVMPCSARCSAFLSVSQKKSNQLESLNACIHLPFSFSMMDWHLVLQSLNLGFLLRKHGIFWHTDQALIHKMRSIMRTMPAWSTSLSQQVYDKQENHKMYEINSTGNRVRQNKIPCIVNVFAYYTGTKAPKWRFCTLHSAIPPAFMVHICY